MRSSTDQLFGLGAGCEGAMDILLSRVDEKSSWRPLAGLGVLLVGWVTWRLASGSGALGGYEVVAKTSYSLGAAARFVMYHGASLLILCGLVPAVAVVLMLVEAVRRGETDERVRAYLAVAVSLSVWIVIEVGVFASRYSDRIVERNLIGLAPVLFLGLVLWLERGPDGGSPGKRHLAGRERRIA